MKSSLLLLSPLCLSPLAASAQDAEAWTGVPIHFDTPGARSLSMGATTVAVTSEPSLAASNPASLGAIGADRVRFGAAYDHRQRTRHASFGVVTTF
ncbi:MAG: hypothetical protein JOZ54_10765 [Acidobacteria bacterium]|nr:hypothetical protein [Acidobacteriota bacterium]